MRQTLTNAEAARLVHESLSYIKSVLTSNDRPEIKARQLEDFLRPVVMKDDAPIMLHGKPKRTQHHFFRAFSNLTIQVDRKTLLTSDDAEKIKSEKPVSMPLGRAIKELAAGKSLLFIDLEKAHFPKDFIPQGCNQFGAPKL